MEYREKRKIACQKLFEGFEPDLKGCRNPDQLLKVLALAREGYFSKEIAEEINKTPKAVQKMFRRYNFPVLHNFAPPRMEERPNWEGGMKESKGYLYKRVLDHPNKSKHGGYVAVHRLVMESKLDRFLLPTEVVDHIDGDIKNNDPKNLRVFPSNAEHLRTTLKGKCPNWTPDGLKALDSSRRRKRRTWKGVAIEPTHG